MNPVDTEVGKHDEEGELDPSVGGERPFGGLVVELAVSTDLSEHQGHGAQRHEGHRLHSCLHLKLDLISEVLGVFKSFFVEYEEKRQRGEDIVYYYTKYPVPALLVS